MLIVGAKGFAKELLEVIYQNNLNEEIAFYDDVSNDLPDLLFERYRIIRDKDSASDYLNRIIGVIPIYFFAQIKFLYICILQ